MTTAYANDPRVTAKDEYIFEVVAPDDRYTVSAWRNTNDWLIDPARDSNARREANIRGRQDAEAFTARTVRGPFGSADEAIRSLIGDPR